MNRFQQQDPNGQHWAAAGLRSIDTRAAQAHPGVVAVFTAADVPANEYGLINADQPVLVGIGSEKAGADVARFVGDQVALVVVAVLIILVPTKIIHQAYKLVMV